MEYTVQGPDGSQHVIAGPDGASDAEVIAQAQKLFPGPSQLESFGRGVENNFPLANQAIAAGSAALGDKSYSQNLSEQNQAIQGAKSANPVSYDAGAVTGALAPLAIPGVGEALEAAPIASGAALGAAGAIDNTDLVQNPTQGLKDAAIGAGTGALLGKILPTGTSSAESVEGFANRKAVQGLGLKPGTLGIPSQELEELGQFAHEAGLTQGGLEQRVGQARDLLQQTGAQIGDMGAGAVPLQDANPFIEQLHQKLQESADIYGPDANQEASAYRQALANLQQPGLTFDKLQQLKTSVGNRAFDGVGDVKNDALANVYGIYKDAMKSIVDASPAEYQETMDTYGKLKDIHSALTNQWQKEQASGIQAKGFGMAGKMGAMVTGGNIPATLGVAGALAPMHPFMAAGVASTIANNPQAMESAARGVAGAIPMAAGALKAGSIDSVTSYLMNTLHTNPQKLGKYAQPLLNAAQQGGSQGIAATHFLLSSQYPEYNSLVMNKEDNNEESR